MSSPLSCVMDTCEKTAGDDGGSAAAWQHSGHEPLQHPLILMVITGKGLQLAFKTGLYSQGHLWVFQAYMETYKKGNEKRGHVSRAFLLCCWWE